MVRTSRLLVLAVPLLASDLTAQFINRATWLGRDEEGVRRDYKQPPEYFLDRYSYVDLPPWWDPELDPWRNRLIAAGGSVSTDRLSVEVLGTFREELGEGFSVHAAYLQSEHQTTQFARFALGFDKRIATDAALFLQLEGTPDKSRADISFGAELFRSPHGAHRLGFTLVDFSSAKSGDFEYARQPYALQWSGYEGDADSLQLAYEVGFQLPFEEQTVTTGDVLRMRRTLASVEGRLRVAERDRIVLRGSGEWTSKSMRTADPADPLREDLDTTFHRLQLEWWRRLDGGHEVSVGGSWLQLRTDGLRSNAPADDLVVRRDEAMLLARGLVDLSGPWGLEPYLRAGRVDFDQRSTDERIGADGKSFGFEGKLGVPLRFAFSPRAFIRFDLSVQLDEIGFAGGGIQFAATF